jgi:hypothetical protein
MFPSAAISCSKTRAWNGKNFDAANPPGSIDVGSTGFGPAGMYTEYYRPADLDKGPW